MSTRLNVVMYHYVRDLPSTRFPRIKGLLSDDFRRQVAWLSEHQEMATLESALAFLNGHYQPDRDLCLLTFDDGLKDHYTEVLPILSERRIEGLFFIITSCLEGRVVSVHKNHFLMAALGFDQYRQVFLNRLAALSPESSTEVDMKQVQHTYRWDGPDVAAFKYLLNFHLEETLRDRILDDLFVEYLGDESAFARDLYLSWDEAREMQACGMVMGGHSHSHVALATMDSDRQRADLETCAGMLDERLRPQTFWPFSYPYGKTNSFNLLTIEVIQDLGFACAFATEVGDNQVGQDLFSIRRIDTKAVHTISTDGTKFVNGIANSRRTVEKRATT
jgi:peptidoglycan/xylan/chitin deacetylase (PgdA/CDA1 family)